MLATLKKVNDPCDVYILAIVDDFGADIVGWCESNELFSDKNKIDLGHGVGYGLNQEYLNKFKNDKSQ